MFEAKKKGQYLVVGEMLIFGMGLLIAIGILNIFTNLNSKVETPVNQAHMSEVANAITHGIESLHTINSTNSYVQIKIPKEIGGNAYTIAGIAREVYVGGNEFWINKTVSVNVSGRAESSAGGLRIFYLNESVSLRGVKY